MATRTLGNRKERRVRDTSELTVVMLSDKAWERLELVAITEPVPLDQWLGWVRDERMCISAEPYSRIEGGEYDGGHVLTLDNEQGRSRFAIPAAALPLLRNYMSPQTYEDLLGRTPKLQRAR